MQNQLEVLIVSNDGNARHRLAEVLAEERLRAVFCSTLSEAQNILPRRPICIVFSDCGFADGDVHGVFRAVERSAADVPVIVVSRGGDRKECVDALKAGAFDYVECSWPRPEFQRVVRQALMAVSEFAP